MAYLADWGTSASFTPVAVVSVQQRWLTSGEPAFFYQTIIPSLPFLCVLFSQKHKDWSCKVNRGNALKTHQKKRYPTDSLVFCVVSWWDGKYGEMKCTLFKREGNSAHYSQHLVGCDLRVLFANRDSELVSYIKCGLNYQHQTWATGSMLQQQGW